MKKKKIIIISLVIFICFICTIAYVYHKSSFSDNGLNANHNTSTDNKNEDINEQKENNEKTQDVNTEETEKKEKIIENKETKKEETKTDNKNSNQNNINGNSQQKSESKQPEQKVEQPVQKEDLASKADAYKSNILSKYFTSQSAAQNLYNTIPSDIKSYFAVNGESVVCSVTVTETDEGTYRKYYYGNGSYLLFAPNKTTNIDGRSISFVDYCNEKYHLKEAESDASYTTTFYYVYKK